MIGLPLLLSTALLAGCGGDGEGTDVDCSLQECVVTFQRGVDASASVFGLKAELVEVKDGMVTVDIGGNQVTVPASGQSEGVSVREVTDEKVVIVVPYTIAG
ncbi:hypothetical protein ACFQO7_24525 [Catellatospora aurea]|uniref:Uncharacterized protein n=1 Tax=Catellatospora aurea TaxID=1337874 RepID=A0ABW2H0L2_9ACTN